MTTRNSGSSAFMLLLLSLTILSACGKKESNASSDTTAAAAMPAGGLTEQESKNAAMCAEYVEKVFVQGDTAWLRAHTSPNFTEHNPFPGQEPGVDGMIKGLLEWKTAFSDMKISIDGLLVRGDTVVMRSTFTGTNTGPFMGAPATNKSVKCEGIDWVIIKDGMQTDHWGQFDVMGMMQQLGMMQPMGGPPPTSEAPAPAGDNAKKDTAG